MQANPNSITPYPPNPDYSDPMFTTCRQPNCYKTFGLRVYNSSYIYLYGAGMYSFFENYDSGCLVTNTCQQTMVSVEMSEAVYFFALNTVGAETMIEVDGVAIALNDVNTNGFAETVAVFEYP